MNFWVFVQKREIRQNNLVKVIATYTPSFGIVCSQIVLEQGPIEASGNAKSHSMLN